MHSFYSTVPFLITGEASKLCQHILKFKSWPQIVFLKKHKAVAHCNNVPLNFISFRNKWKRKSGIYKITFLPFRLFTYYGSSSDLGARFKYHYFNGAKQSNFLGLFINVFGWNAFSITVVELCDKNQLYQRENWYLSKFSPLLNVLKISYIDPRQFKTLSPLTRSKISASLTGKKDSEETRTKKSESKIGSKNPFFEKGPGLKAIEIAAEKRGKKVYAYDKETFSLVNKQPFRSIKKTTESLPISEATLPSKLDTGAAFKGYYYYTKPQYNKPKF